MDQRGLVTRHSQGVAGCTTPYSGATRRCPVQPSTPLGPDQVNVLLLLRGEGSIRPLTALIAMAVLYRKSASCVPEGLEFVCPFTRVLVLGRAQCQRANSMRLL
jgi:hypothetical protein